MEDTRDSKSLDSNIVRVRLSLSAFYGPLAQWLEQPAHNRSVLGSNPRRSIFVYCEMLFINSMKRRNYVMMCKLCKSKMVSGTRYEQKRGENILSYKNFFECNNCHSRIYTNISGSGEGLNRSCRECKM